jgi:hypothetical protein
MSNAGNETWVQYSHLDKLYGHLPGLARRNESARRGCGRIVRGPNSSNASR